MTELRKSNGLDTSTPRLHKQHSFRERDRHPGHPLLHSLADHGCNLSSGGNSAASTTSSSTATATTALNGGAGGVLTAAAAGISISSQRSVEFDEHDIFYVSPSKRKGGSTGIGSNNHNVVTFSNFVSEQRVTPASSHRGSLKRSKGRSNQSLCSCDAGDEAQLQPDAARPLYEYSLERRRKTHTYTCEQNAQILMRLERERNRKLSLTLTGTGTGIGGEAGGEDLLQQCDANSLSDVDIIPPQWQHEHQQQQQQHQQQQH
ncbi:uncharacterized protein Dwil_GK14578 [Drosophila willistoni]|uniref:Uncharacterized protein n=1 Tax=Drosophila willistoni TaxID=7260 RepID=B4MWV9_DROWI|nr:uncharacterized protein Dwil_GK14578 [Drosophila willistoni]